MLTAQELIDALRDEADELRHLDATDFRSVRIKGTFNLEAVVRRLNERQGK